MGAKVTNHITAEQGFGGNMTTNEQEAKHWNDAGAIGVTAESVAQSRAKSADMLWIGTEPCYRAETNAHISAFYQMRFEQGYNMDYNGRL
jgi:hypothetical protein